MRSGPALVAALVLLALAGCTPSAVHVPSSPSASATPVFASDADALKAAEAAYAAYLKVSASISADGGAEADRIDSFVTNAQARREHATSEYFSSHQLHTIGDPTFGRLVREGVSFDTAGGAKVAFYVCVDASSVRVLNASGSDVTPSDRANRAALEVRMESSRSDLRTLLISESDTWPGSGIC